MEYFEIRVGSIYQTDIVMYKGEYFEGDGGI